MLASCDRKAELRSDPGVQVLTNLVKPLNMGMMFTTWKHNRGKSGIRAHDHGFLARLRDVTRIANCGAIDYWAIRCLFDDMIAFLNLCTVQNFRSRSQINYFCNLNQHRDRYERNRVHSQSHDYNSNCSALEDWENHIVQ